MFKKAKISFILTILFLLLVWSSAYTAIFIGLDSFSPGSLALFRFFIATVCLSVYALTKKISLPAAKDIPIILLCGFLGIALYQITLNIGRASVSAGSVSIILNSYPIFVAVLSSIILKENINHTKWLGILISFSGLAFIAISESHGFKISPGILLLLIGAISLSFFDVIQKKLLVKYNALELTLYFFITGTLFLSIYSGSLITQIKTATLGPIIAGGFLGIFCSAISYLLWAKLVSKYSVSSLATSFYLIPVFTIFIAFIFLKEIPSVFSLIGGAIALAGVGIVSIAKENLIPKDLISIKTFQPDMVYLKLYSRIRGDRGDGFKHTKPGN